jgi:molecular chaperone DnaK
MSLAIGIDLGTTNTVVAGMRNDRPEIVRTSEGKDYIPSVVCEDSESHERYIGMQARNWMDKEPRNTIYSIKRLMGMLVEDDVSTRGPTSRRRPANVLAYEQIKQKLGYNIEDDATGGDDCVRVRLGEKQYKPEDISAMIIAQAKKEAERYFGVEVRSAVITVPAYFEDKQKAATRKAGEIAGLEVLHILDEPTAAAIAAGVAKPRSNQSILVYDFGGGTFDVSLLKVDGQNYLVRELGGDNWLGGDDFDHELTKLIAEKIRSEHPDYDPMADVDFRSHVKLSVEGAKIWLSKWPEVEITAPNCCKIKNRPISVNGLRVLRTQYEELIGKFVGRSIKLVGDVLKAAKVTPNMVDAVLMVGGTTKTPCVWSAVEAMFPGKLTPEAELDPMTCVATGAAIWAAQKSSRDRVIKDDVIVRTVTERSFGIAVREGQDSDMFQVIVPKGTRIPMKAPIEKEFIAHRPDRLYVPIYAGDDNRASQNSFQGLIDVEFVKEGQPPLEPGTPVNVRFRVNDDKILMVSVIPRGRAPIDKPLEYSFNPDTNDEWRRDLERSVEIAQHFLLEYAEYTDPEICKRLKTVVDRAEMRLAEPEPNRREARFDARRIDREVLYSSSLGSLLFRAGHLAQRADLPVELGRTLQVACTQAKAAYKRQRDNPSPAADKDVAFCRERLDIGVNYALKTIHEKNPQEDPGHLTPK